MRHDVIIIGGGVIGLCVARALSPARSVLLVERDEETGLHASWAAAGMLCPQSEAEQDDALFRFGLRSLEAYSNLAADLLSETEIDVEYRPDGVLVFATDDGEMEALEKRAAWQESAGLQARLLARTQWTRMEPALTLNARGALFCPNDHQVEPRRLLAALRRSCRLRGVDFAEQATVEEILISRGAVRGVRVGTTEFYADQVVVAAGSWASRIRGLEPPIALSPRKGQILALQMPDADFRHLIRWRSLYFVPRNDNRLVVGATNEDRGFDRSVTPSGLAGLLQGALDLSARVGDYPIVEMWTGLRPMTSNGRPSIGPAGIDGLYYALGHYRNGILWAPATAEAIDRCISSGSVPDFVREFVPGTLPESVESGKV